MSRGGINMDTKNRLSRLRDYMQENKIELSIIVNPENQFYVSGFKAIIYSRPIILGIKLDKTFLIVPGLEEEHSKAHANVDEIFVYYEQPEKINYGTSHLDHLKTQLSEYSCGKKIGIEFNTMSVGLSSFIEVFGYKVVDICKKITEMRYIKEEQEIEIMLESGKLVSLALKTSLENAKPGIAEMELDQFGNRFLLEEASKKYPNATIDIFVMSPSGLHRTLMPHVFSNTRKFAENEIILHSRQVGLNGYRAECERTFFIGKPTNKQKDVFKVMVEAQRAALDFIRPGVMAKEVDMVARKIIQDNGYGEYSVHRTGHGIGLGLHEEPYLRFDSELLLQEGMAFSVEPGIYVPEIGGFRHSDTVILTKNGKVILTDYPSDLTSLML